MPNSNPACLYRTAFASLHDPRPAFRARRSRGRSIGSPVEGHPRNELRQTSAATPVYPYSSSVSRTLGRIPVVGAITGAMGEVPRSAPAMLYEFGLAIFGRGAFDPARRVS
jgi:hypothetical protein